MARGAGLEPYELAATGGDDYELLVAVPPGQRARAGAELTWIGEVRAGDGLVLEGAGGELRGYEHG